MSASIASLALVLGGLAEAQPLLPVADLALYDAGGRRVGPIAYDGSSLAITTVVIRKGRLVLPLRATTQALSAAGVRHSYESNDCTGTPLVRRIGRDLLMSPQIGGLTPEQHMDPAAQTIVWIPDPDESPRTIALGSEARGDGCEVRFGEPQEDMVPARPVLDVREFQPPFELRAEPAVDVPALERRVSELESRVELLLRALGGAVPSPAP